MFIITTYIPLCKHRAHKNIYINHDSEAIHLKNKKNKLWKRYTTTRSPSDHHKFCLARNYLRNLTRKLRYDFEKDLTSIIKTNPKRFWQYTKSRLNTNISINDIHGPDDVFVNNDLDKAKLFNNYFCSVFTNEDPHSIIPPFTLPMTVTPCVSIDITPDMVLNKLLNLNISKSAGPDGWPPIVLKEVAHEICLPLYIIFSKSLNSGTVPDSWIRVMLFPFIRKVVISWLIIITLLL